MLTAFAWLLHSAFDRLLPFNAQQCAIAVAVRGPKQRTNTYAHALQTVYMPSVSGVTT